MRVILIRHGRTKGNLEKRYVGRTDEGILTEEKEYLQIHASAYEAVAHVYCSPMKRCIETADILYPQIAHTRYQGLQECDFGTFEYHNYIELAGDTAYQKWINSNGTLPFPEGERVESFKQRCIQEFQSLVTNAIVRQYNSIACVVHGGTIMAIMEAFADSVRNYYDWQVDNLAGYLTEVCICQSEKEIRMTSYQKIERES